MTSGERRFAERLEDKLDDDYLLWYDVPVGRRALHPDFIVLHPRRGLLVLEVKDWRIDTIQAMSRTQATLITSRGVKHELNPLEQARQYAHEVVRLLERDPSLLAVQGERHQGKLAFPWSYGVVLANITRRQFAETDLDQTIPGGRVICRDEIYDDVDPERLQKQLWDMFPWQLRSALSLPQIDRVRWHIHPEIRINPPTPRDIFDDTVPDVIRIMDVQQEFLARSLGDGHRVIHGVAGSGKTMILAYRCLHLAKVIDKPVLVLCYNKTLAAKLQEVMAEGGVSDRVAVRNFHAWCRDQLKLYHVELPPSGSSSEYADQLVARVIRAVERGQIPSGQYGAVLIDEGHDFQPEWLKLATQMVDPTTESLLLLYDDAQSIYGRSRRQFSLKSVGVQAQGRTTILRLNYRNTAEVLRAAYEFAKDALTPEESDDDGIPVILPESADRHGPSPELVRLPSLDEEAEYVARRLVELHAEGTRWGDMAIVYRSAFIGEKLADRLRAAGVPVSWLTKDGRAKRAAGDPNSVNIVTFHSSKGLEYPVVAIPGLGYLPYESEEESQEIRLAYVAMTRAMDRLIMTCHRQSPFVRRLVAAGTAIAA
jgi:hypothetical protein